MSFVTNPVQQLTIDDSTFHITDREISRTCSLIEQVLVDMRQIW